MRLVFLAAAILLAGCQETPPEGYGEVFSREEFNRRIALPLQPQPILESEIEDLEFLGRGCVFSPAGGGHGAMVLAMEQAGYMKFNDKIVRFAADSGSSILRNAVRERYIGTTHLFRLTFADEDRARLTVEDSYGNIVFEEVGRVWCDE